MKSQNQIVLSHLVNYGSITQKQCWDMYRIERLSARIYDLKRRGKSISAIYHRLDNGCRYAEYVLSN
ncbi:MAG TPA: hypothetical protein DHM44_03870 [Flexistipes sinusarabici]|uniref:Winged helix-turn-helix domain-containing protein n=1 Tax=Flexistipes sinusarabici TaxID=2352 RepID=A0A3D5QAW8_FLESI|nr:hypothetical protein [Flexistipes sinusarabici]